MVTAALVALVVAVAWLAVEVRRLRRELERPDPVKAEPRPVRQGRAFVPRG
jgi:hypothetical protein